MDKHEAVLLDSESETEDTDTLTLNSNSTASSTPSTLTLDQCPSDSTSKLTSSYKDQLTNNNNSRLSLDSKLKSESDSQQDVRHTRSLQFPFTSSSASIPEHDYESSRLGSETSAGFHQRFHRKIGREESGGGGRILNRTRQDRREERKRLIAERSDEPRSSIGSIDDSTDRRGSEELILTDSELRRGSRDSNQSYQSEAASPSHSSQDSLFNLNRPNGLTSGPNVLTQSLSYGYAPIR